MGVGWKPIKGGDTVGGGEKIFLSQQKNLTFPLFFIEKWTIFGFPSILEILIDFKQSFFLYRLDFVWKKWEGGDEFFFNLGGNEPLEPLLDLLSNATFSSAL